MDDLYGRGRRLMKQKPNSEEERRSAVRLIVARTDNPVEALTFLDMLGLEAKEGMTKSHEQEGTPGVAAEDGSSHNAMAGQG